MTVAAAIGHIHFALRLKRVNGSAGAGGTFDSSIPGNTPIIHARLA
jgi:hypothetical protein